MNDSPSLSPKPKKTVGHGGLGVLSESVREGGSGVVTKPAKMGMDGIIVDQFGPFCAILATLVVSNVELRAIRPLVCRASFAGGHCMPHVATKKLSRLSPVLRLHAGAV